MTPSPLKSFHFGTKTLPLVLGWMSVLAGAETARAAGTIYTLPSSTFVGWETAPWTMSGNPSGNTFPNAPGDVAQYLGAGSSATAVDRSTNGPITIGQLLVGGVGTWNVTSGSASALVLDNTGGTGPAKIQTTSSGTLNVGASVVVQNTDLLISTGVDQTGTINLSGGVTGTGNVTLNGARGQTVITADSINNTGTLSVAVSAANQTGTSFSISSVGSNVTSLIVGDAANPTFGGALNLTGTSTLTGGVTIQGGATLRTTNEGLNATDTANGITFGATGGTLQGVGAFTTAKAIVLNGAGTVTNLGGETMTLNGPTSGSGNLVKSGGGTVILGGTASNLATGDTMVVNGALAGQLSLQKTGVAVAVSGNLVLDANVSGTAVGIGTAANTTRNQFGLQFGSGSVISFTNTTSGKHAYFMLYGNDQTVAGLSEAVAAGGVVENSQTEVFGIDSVLTINNSADYSYAGYLRNGSTGGTGTLGIVKSGTGTQTFNGAQITYTGGTTINNGTLELKGASNFASVVTFGASSTGTLSIGSAAQPIRGLATVDATNNSAIVQNSAGIDANLTINQSVDTSFGGVLQDNAGGNILTVTKAGSGTLTLTNSTNSFSGPLILTAGAVSASTSDVLGGINSVLTFSGGTLRITGTDFTSFGARTINEATFNGGLDIADANNEFLLFQDLGGTGGLTKAGAGTLVLSGTNTYTGATTINAGTVRLESPDALTHSVNLIFGNAAPAGTTLQLNGFDAVVGSATNSGLQSTATTPAIENGSFIPATFTVLSGTNNTYAGLIQDGEDSAALSFKRGGGNSTLLLSGANTYTGSTTLNSGTTAVTILGNGGVGSGIGASTSAATNLVLDGGSLQYVGSTLAATNRAFSLGLAGGGLDASGVGAGSTVNFSNAAAISFAGGTGTRTLTLRGSNTGNNILAAQIVDNAGATSLVKEGAGTWVLTNSNTHTGATTINGGKLVISGALTASAVTVNAGALGGSGNGTTTGVIGTTTGTTGVTVVGGSSATRGTIDLVDGVLGTLTLLASPTANGLVLGGTAGNAAALNFEIAAASASDHLAVPAAKIVINAGGARINIAGLGGFGLGTYDLITFTGGQASGLTSLYLGTTPGGGFSYSLKTVAGSEQLVVSSAPTSGSWNVNANGNWFTSGNWAGGNIPNGTGATATFGPVNAATRTVTLDASAAVGTLAFNSASSYVLAASNDSILALNNNGQTATISVTTGSHTISAPIALVDTTNVVIDGTMLTVSGVVSGTAPLVKSGAGILALNNVNTYTGGTVINGGTVRVTSDNSFGNAPATLEPGNVVLNGGTIQSMAAMTTANNRGFMLGPNGGTIIAAAGNLNFPSVIADQSTPGALSIGAGAGLYVPSGQSTYSGGTTILPGASVVPVGSSTGPAGAPVSGALGTGVINFAGGQIRATSSGPVVLGNAVNFTADTRFNSAGANVDKDLTFTGPITLTGGTRTLTVESSPSTGNTGVFLSGAIGDGGNHYGIVKDGVGALVLGGANTYSGPVTIKRGTVVAANATALGTSTVTLGDAAGGSAALLGSGAVTIANSITVQASAAGTLTLGNSLPGAAVFSGPIALNNALSLASSSTAGSVTLSGVITGSANLTVTGSTGNFVQLSGINTPFTGDVAINSGTLRIGGASALTANNRAVLATGATLDLNNNSLTLKSLAGTGGSVIQNGASARTLTVGDSTDTTFAGALTATTAANLALTKVGTGTLTLSGLSTYAGITTISAGTLLLDLGTNNSGVLNSASALSFGGATLRIKAAGGGVASAQGFGSLTLAANTANTIVIDPNGGSGTTLTLGNTWTRGANGTLLIDLSGGSSIVVSNPNLAVNGLLSFVTVKDATGSGFGQVSGGNIVRAAGGTALTSTSNAGTTNFTTAPNDGNYPGGTLTMAAGAHATNSLSIDTSSGPGILNLTGASLTFTSGGVSMNGASDFTIQGGTTGASAAELIVQQWGAGKLTIAGAISGATGSLTKLGTGTLSLTGTNTYTGLTSIQDGTLAVSGGSAIADSGQVVLANKAGAIFQVNGSETIAQLTGGGASGGEVALGSGATLTLSSAVNATYSGVITGAGGLTKAGANTVTLSGANTYGGTTAISAGFLKITNGNALGNTGSLTTTTVADTTHLELSGGITVNNENVSIIGNGGSDNAGALRSVDGVNTWAGTVTIAANGARIGATGGSTLILSGIITDGPSSFPLTIRADSLTSKVVVSGGANDYGGATNLVVGTLQLDGGNNRLPIGSALAVGNAPNQGIGARLDLNGFSQQFSGLTSLGTTMVMDVTSATAATLTVNNSGANTYNGTLTGALALTKSNGGALTLGGVNAYSGATTINNGTLRAGAAGAFSGSSAFTLVNTATAVLDLAGFSQTIGSLAGGGTSGGNVALGAGTLTTGDNNLSTSYAGILSGGGGLTKRGTGTMTLGNSQTYTGPTTVSGGTLNITGSISASTSVSLTSSTLLFSANQALNNVNTTVSLGSSSTLAMANDLHNAVQTLSGLALLGDATINFGSVGLSLGGNTFSFANLTMGGHLLSITNWTGSDYSGVTSDPGDPNQDRLLFSSSLSISDAELAAIRFYDEAGGLIGTGAKIEFNGGYEIVAVPEASSLALLGGVVPLALARFRRRRRECSESGRSAGI